MSDDVRGSNADPAPGSGAASSAASVGWSELESAASAEPVSADIAAGSSESEPSVISGAEASGPRGDDSAGWSELSSVAASDTDAEQVIVAVTAARPRARNLTHPERDEHGRRTRPWMQWPTLLVLAVVGSGLLVIALGRFRAGAVVIAAGALLALFLRLLLEPNQAGWLVNRSRWVDVTCLGVLGVGLAILAFAVPAPS